MNTQGQKVFVLIGLEKTLKDLKEFDKKAVRKFNRLVNTELTKVQEEARALVPAIRPMSGWSVTTSAIPGGKARKGDARLASWNSAEVASGIRKSRAQQRLRGDYTTSAGALMNTTAAGKIFETAGWSTKQNRSTMKDGNRASQQFKQTLRDRFGAASRLTWRVVFHSKERIEHDVEQAYKEIQQELQRHLDSPKSK